MTSVSDAVLTTDLMKRALVFILVSCPLYLLCILSVADIKLPDQSGRFAANSKNVETNCRLICCNFERIAAIVAGLKKLLFS